jgi:hypothetical protein
MPGKQPVRAQPEVLRPEFLGGLDFYIDLAPDLK